VAHHVTARAARQFRKMSHIRRRAGTSRSCPLRAKQVCIQASCDARSPPRPDSLNVRPPVSMAHPADELGQVMRERGGSARVLIGGGHPGQPGLH
jgi:hypothetical protein